MVNRQDAGADPKETPDLENIVPDESIVLASDSHEVNLLSGQDFNRRMDSLLNGIAWRNHDIVTCEHTHDRDVQRARDVVDLHVEVKAQDQHRAVIDGELARIAETLTEETLAG